jgi:type IV secretory pathway VirJ component
VLVGYSMGGSVLPFLVDRLPEDLRPSVRAVVLLGPAREVDFKFHLASWLGKASYAGDHPVLPELEGLRGTRVLCFYGQEDKDCICPDLPQGLTEVIALRGGHRVGGQYRSIADSVVALAR